MYIEELLNLDKSIAQITQHNECHLWIVVFYEE